ncbi:hypothetical protein FRC98_11290 [Lujinxingia vulgaris]|uniref:Uncharacterized protein n=1 Tax=Lujinxingia vulgaris TaxID=2600176 RepID=A0A5C6XC66_9DELT|nr:hypothetical protein [Lujinxingia vulgaris]TXD37307.1 hypothetical protein FRC98_11290 [Lujinxingia vulgaris]
MIPTSPGTPRGALALFAIVAALAFTLNLPPAEAWRPLPEPDTDDLLDWQPLLEPEHRRELAPGDATLFSAPRNAVVRLQFDPPRLASALRVEERVASNDGLTTASLPLEPFVLDGGDWFILSGVSHSPTLRVALDERAGQSVTISAHTLDHAPPRLYWDWWQRRLHRWLQVAPLAPPPADLPIAARARVISQAREAQLLHILTDALTDDAVLRQAAHHLGRAMLTRAIQRERQPDGRFHARRPIAPAFEPALPEATVSLPTGPSAALRLKPGEDAHLTVDGPARLELGVRAVKTPENAEQISPFSLQIFERGHPVHRADFSSGPARFLPDGRPLSTSSSGPLLVGEDDDAPREDPAEDATTDLDRDPELDPASPARHTGVLEARDEQGTPLSWRRTTSMWVPPGRHHYTLRATDAEILIDGHIARPRYLLQDVAGRLHNADWHIERAEQLLSGSDHPAATLLLAEIASFLGQVDNARNLLFAARKSQAPAAHQSAWITWLELRLNPGELAAPQALLDLVQSELLPPASRRLIGLQAARQELALGYPELAAAKLDALPEDPQGDAIDLPLERALRAETILTGGSRREARWAGFDLLYAAWLREPIHPDRTDALQTLWWYATYWRDLEPLPPVRLATPATDATAEDAAATPEQALPPEPTPFLEPLGPADTRTFLASVADRTTLLYRLPHEQAVTLGAPTDAPTAAQRLTLTARAAQRPAVAALKLDSGGEPHTFAFLHDAPLQEFELLTTTNAPLRVQNLSPDPITELYTPHPPQDVEWLPSDHIVIPRDYWEADSEGVRFALESSGTTRYVRLHLRPTAADRRIRLRIDDGANAPRDLFLDASAHARATYPAPLRLILQLPPEAQHLEVRALSQNVFVALDQRAAREDQSVDPIPVAVTLPPSPQTLQRISLLSRSINDEATLSKKRTLQVERAELLMSLGQNALAEVDLYAAAYDFRTPGDTLERARGLLATLRQRADRRWVQLPDASLVHPTALSEELSDALFEENQRDPATLASCEADLRYGPPAPDMKPACAAIRALANTPAEARGDLLLDFARQRSESTRAADAPLLRAAADLLVTRLTDPTLEPDPGQAALAHLLATRAFTLAPTPAHRSTYFATLRLSRFAPQDTPTLLTAMASVPADLDPTPVDPLPTPPTANPLDELVEDALLGVPWPPELLLPLNAAARRTFTLRPELDQPLEVAATCLDLRPDLQPEGPAPSCLLHLDLVDQEGNPVSPGTSPPAWPPGQLFLARFDLKAGQTYRLTLRRHDDLLGRRFIVFPYLLDPAAPGEPQPVVASLRRRLDVLAPGQPVDLSIVGPTTLRLDLRALFTPRGSGYRPASEVIVELQSADGHLHTHRVTLPSSAQPDASIALPGLSETRLSAAQRLHLPVVTEGLHSLTVRVSEGLATLRLAARQDDDRAIARARKGEPEGVTTADTTTPDAPPKALATRALNLDQTLLADLPRGLAELSGDDLLSKPPVDWTLRFSSAVATRDIDLEESLIDDPRQSPYARLNTRAYLANPDADLWVYFDTGLRTNLRTSPVAEGTVAGYWRTQRLNLRIEPRLTTYWQRFTQSHWSIRSSMRISKPLQLAPNWSLFPSLAGHVRLQEPRAFFRTRGLIDPVLYNNYALPRRLGFDARVTLWFRPFVNTIFAASARQLFSNRAYPDQLWLSTEARALFESTDLRVGYRLRHLFDDPYRDTSTTAHDLNFDASLAYWTVGNLLLDFNASAQLSLVPGERDPRRARIGFALSVWHNLDNFSRVPPSHASLGHLLTPEFFLHRSRP